MKMGNLENLPFRFIYFSCYDSSARAVLILEVHTECARSRHCLFPHTNIPLRNSIIERLYGRRFRKSNNKKAPELRERKSCINSFL